MAPEGRSKAKQPSPSPSASSSSEASSSRSMLEVEDVVAAAHSDQDQASTHGSDTDDEDDVAEDDNDDVSEEDTDDDDHQRPTIDLAKARKKLHHVAKTIRATAKKSKTFEVQKLVKKLKGLRKRDTLADQAELAEKELTALKSIDTGLLAGRALITKMVKAKLLPRPAELEDADEDDYLYLSMVKDEDLLGEEVLHDPVAVDGDRALERAKAKITSSKVLADEVGKFVDELKKLAGIEPVNKRKDDVTDIKGKGKAKQLVNDDDEEEREWSGSDDDLDSDEGEPRRLPVEDDDDVDDEEDADEEELARIGREKVKALGDLSQWDDMVGSDSAPESDSGDEAPAKQKRKRETDSEASSVEDSTDEDDSDSSDSDSDSDSDSSPASKRSKKSKSTSTFLPTLSTGFVPGRSDDEWSDAEADLADRDLSDLTGAKKERKNRMGQRARKALYEKKYGKNANHIKMKEKRKADKLERTPSRPNGVTGGRQRPPAFQAPKKTDGGWGGKVAPLPKQPRVTRAPKPVPVAVEAPKKEQAKSKTQEMHPSWIAKQKQKELMAQVKPQGKKVVFD